MSQLPRFTKLSREDFPGLPSAFEQIFVVLNETLGGLISAASGRLSRGENVFGAEKLDFTFTTKPTLAATWPVQVKNDLPAKPKHVWLTRLERSDGTAITDAFSMTWALNTSGLIGLSFQGLVVSTHYKASIAYE